MAVLSIVLLPDNKINRFTIGLSKKLSSKSDTFFTLDGKKFYAHITLADIKSKDKNIGSMKNGLLAFAKRFKPFNVVLSDFAGEKRWFGWNCVKDSNINKLHNESVRYMSRFKKEQKDRVNFYRPHITITRYKKQSDLKRAFAVIHSKRANFTAKYIVLCKKSRHRTVTNIIAKSELGKI